MSIMYLDDSGNVKEERYSGCVLCLGEHNYYDDSDFYAVVFHPETGKVEEVIYRTTRCASMGMSAYKDITPENLALYRKTRRELEQKIAVARAWHDHDERASVRRATGITFKQLEKLMGAYPHTGWAFDTACALLSTRNFRSEFRKGMASQIRQWLEDPSPRYGTPLSDRQLEWVGNRHQKVYWKPYIGGSIIYEYPTI